MDPDLLLTNVSVYWFTGTGASAARFMYESHHASAGWAPPAAPQGFAVFGGGGAIIRPLIDPGSHAAHWSAFARGGHFPAMEVPDLLVADVRQFFRRLR